MSQFFSFYFALLIITGITVTGTQSKASFLSFQQEISGSDQHIEMLAVPIDDSDAEVDSFWMSAHEITWDIYELFLFREVDHIAGEMIANGINVEIDGVSGATTPYVDMSNGMGKKGYPVINVTQYAASTFCQWLTAKTGRFYRLPTEAEWEYACRAGSKTKYAHGKSRKELQDFAWFGDNSDKKYHQVGEKKPNEWGFYDMHGNVAEWVIDPDFDQKDQSKLPLYPRIVMGGSWQDEAKSITSDTKMSSKKEWKMQDPQLPKSLWWFTNAPFVGFRIVRPLVIPENYEDWWVQPKNEYD